MTNSEIDLRLKTMAQFLPELAEKRKLHDPGGVNRIELELELLNVSIMAVWTMLGEIAKRLPETESKKKK